MRQIAWNRVLQILQILLLVGLVCGSARASTSTLTGTLLDSNGNPFNGRVTFQLPMSAIDMTNNAAIAPTVSSFAVRNGSFQPNATLEDVNTLSPAGLYYTAYRYDASGGLISIDNYLVTGASFNFGLALPVAVTTSNVTLLQPASLAVAQTWTALQTFNLGVSVLRHLNAAAGGDVAGASSCSTGTKTITFASTFASTPAVIVSDETAAGGARVSSKSNSGFTVACTGASDAFDYLVVGQPN
jgi:hypothetical protein